jgi:phosphohistidine phosphatase
MLLLIRHAKAEQDGLTDAARELSDRGIRDARAAGEWLAGHGFSPEHVVVSDAVRAQQTWEAISSTLGTTPTVATDPRIYDNTVSALLEVAGDVPADVAVAALVGHNPSIHSTALAINNGDGDRAARSRLGASYPTMGIAVFEIDGEWSAIARGSGTLVAFDAPRA